VGDRSVGGVIVGRVGSGEKRGRIRRYKREGKERSGEEEGSWGGSGYVGRGIKMRGERGKVVRV